jgi:hypothetical protein
MFLSLEYVFFDAFGISPTVLGIWIVGGRLKERKPGTPIWSWFEIERGYRQCCTNWNSQLGGNLFRGQTIIRIVFNWNKVNAIWTLRLYNMI